MWKVWDGMGWDGKVRWSCFPHLRGCEDGTALYAGEERMMKLRGSSSQARFLDSFAMGEMGIYGIMTSKPIKASCFPVSMYFLRSSLRHLLL